VQLQRKAELAEQDQHEVHRKQLVLYEQLTGSKPRPYGTQDVNTSSYVRLLSYRIQRLDSSAFTKHILLDSSLSHVCD
jgi:hypothetical protein